MLLLIHLVTFVLSCTAPCATCSGSLCTTCVSGSMTLSAGQCSCPSGNYINVSNPVCLSCSYPCQTCVTLGTKCLSCTPASVSALDCICPIAQTYNASGLCISCNAPCASCIQLATKCTSCIDPIRIYNSTANTCTCPYPKFDYWSISCIDCIAPCLTCSGNIWGCSSCLPGFVPGPSYTCVCPSGYYNQSMTCVPCVPPCKTCTSLSYCQTCSEGIRYPSNGQCLCRNGFYDTGIACVKCNPLCLTCISETKCTSCLSNAILTDKICRCQYGYVFENSQCLPCQQPCKACINQFGQIFMNNLQYCFDCIDMNLMILSQGQCICKTGYYLTHYYTCYKCQNLCVTCANTSINCTSCIDGFILENYECRCPIGRYLMNNQCLQCNNTCLSCSNEPIKCNTCSNQLRYLEQGKCQCKAGYTEISTSCIKCSPQCQSCYQSPSFCIYCSDPIMTLYQGTCSCPINYYMQANTCQICIHPCATCSYPGNMCLSCSDSVQVLVDDKCVCPSSYYIDSNLVCQLCDTTLGKLQLICQYANCYDGIWTYGEICDDGNQLNNDGCSGCQMDRNYQCHNIIGKPSQCYQCASKCKQCTQDQCLQCIDGYFVPTYSQNQCIQCNPLCLTCNSNQSCIKCRFKTQVNICLYCENFPGLYSDYQTNTCYSICGDYRFASEYEQCDDGNLINGDGCNAICQLEINYYFNSATGQVYFVEPPQPIIFELFNSDIFNQIRVFNITFSQLLQSNHNSSIISLINISSKSIYIDYTYEIQQVSIYSDFLYNITLTINFTLIQDCIDTRLTIYYNESLIRNYLNISTNISNQSIILNDFIFVSDTQIFYTGLSRQITQDLFYLLIAIVIIGIFLGGLEMFNNLLDILQLCSYLLYTNTQLPYCIYEYLNVFNFAQLQFIANYFNIISYIPINADRIPTGPIKIYNDGFYPLIIINMAALLTAWVILLSTYIVAVLLPFLLNQLTFEIAHSSTAKIKLITFVLIIKEYLYKTCTRIQQGLMYSGILSTHFALSMNYCFVVILNFYVLGFNQHPILDISSVLTIILLVLYCIIIFLCVSLIIKWKSQDFKYKFESLQQELNCRNVIGSYYNIILMLKKLIFMIFLILPYDVALYQIVNILVLYCLSISLMIIYQPIESYVEQNKQLSCEILTALLIIIFVMFVIDDEFELFPQTNRDRLGFVSIALITIMLLVQVGFSIQQQMKFLKQFYYKFKRIIEQYLSAKLPKQLPIATRQIFLT